MSKNLPQKLATFLGPVLALIIFVVITLTYIRSHFTAHPNQDGSRVELAVGKILPVFDLTSFSTHRAISIAEVPAKVIVLNFWATWCDACMEEMPSLARLRERYASAGLEVIGVNLDENPELVVDKTVKKYGIKFPLFKDVDGKLSDLFDVHAIPSTFVFDKSRKILYIKEGGQDWFSQEVNQLMDEWLSR